MGRLLREALPPDPERLVVDVGCGTGANIASLAGDYACVGVDQSADAIRLARRRFSHVEFIQGDAPDVLCDRAGRIDGLIMSDVLEHVEDDRGLLHAQLGALRPGGVALLTVPADMRLWSEHDVTFGHFRRYDAPMFRAVWADEPVDELMVSHFNTRLYPVVRAVRLLGRLRRRTWGKGGTDLSVPPGPVNDMLRRVFEGEGKKLLALLQGRRTRGYGYGVSLIALLRKRDESGGSG